MVFSASEQKELEKVLYFFDNTICNSEKIKKKKLILCYNKYLSDLTSIAETGVFDIGISLEKQDSFFKKIDKKLFNNIFVEGDFYLNRKRIINNKVKLYPDTIPNYLFNVKGKYVQFLKELGKDNPKLMEYYTAVSEYGDISIPLFNDVLMGYRGYDISNDDIRTVIAIHYLLLNKRQMEIRKSEKILDKQLSNQQK